MTIIPELLCSHCHLPLCLDPDLTTDDEGNVYHSECMNKLFSYEEEAA